MDSVVKNVRKAGLPKRLPVSSGGHVSKSASVDSSMDMRPLTVGWRGCLEIEAIGVSLIESVIVKIKETMSVCVGEARYNSWSCGESMRRVGWRKESLSCGIGGVSGVVSGALEVFFAGFTFDRRRGTSLGST